MITLDSYLFGMALGVAVIVGVFLGAAWHSARSGGHTDGH